MKLLLTKFRISAALDAGKQLPASLRQKIAAEPELEHFAHRTQALHWTLRNPPLAAPSMHDSIMRAVRVSAQREQPRREPLLAWLTAAATTAVSVAAVWLWITHRHSGSPEITASWSRPSLNDFVMGVVQQILDHYPLRRC
jgi:hypothetical protein